MEIGKGEFFSESSLQMPNKILLIPNNGLFSNCRAKPTGPGGLSRPVHANDPAFPADHTARATGKITLFFEQLDALQKTSVDTWAGRWERRRERTSAHPTAGLCPGGEFFIKNTRLILNQWYAPQNNKRHNILFYQYFFVFFTCKKKASSYNVHTS